MDPDDPSLTLKLRWNRKHQQESKRENPELRYEFPFAVPKTKQNVNGDHREVFRVTSRANHHTAGNEPTGCQPSFRFSEKPCLKRLRSTHLMSTSGLCAYTQCACIAHKYILPTYDFSKICMSG